MQQTRIIWNEKQLERIIREIVARRYAAPEGSAARRMAERQLVGLRGRYELADGIIREADEDGWGCY